MPVENALRNRINDLLDRAPALRRTNEHGQAHSEEQLQQCSGWMAAASHAIQLALGGGHGAYWDSVKRITQRERGWLRPLAVGELAELLQHLLDDMDCGLLGSVTDRARAETFDDFLDHAKAYLDDGRPKEAGVIVGVVFEDAVRRICRKHEIEERGVKLDDLISQLVKAGHLTDLKAKRARVAGGVRTKATHAQWEEFTDTDVTEAVAFTRELIEAQLGT